MTVRNHRSLAWRGPISAALAVFAACAPAMAADAFSTDWAKSAKSDARLVAAGPALAAFEIRLAPGAITYWRDPGDAGVPPTFDVSKSDNVARIEASFPPPKRIAEPDGSEAFGYDSDVTIPLRVVPADPSKPVTLALEATYAVCEKLCLPARARLALALPWVASPYAGAVEAALAAAPSKIAPADFGALTGDAASGWRLCADREAGPARDLFVEPPAGWWVAVAPGAHDPTHDCFAVTLREKPGDAVLPVSLRLTMTGGKGPVETTVLAQ